MHSFSKH